MSTIALNSVFVESCGSWYGKCGCGYGKSDVYDTFLGGQFPRSGGVYGSRRNVIFYPTSEVQDYMLKYMADTVCTTPDNLFLVRPNSLVQYRTYEVDVQSIDPTGYTYWNSTLVGPKCMPSLSLGQWYLLYGSEQLPVHVNGAIINLRSMPAETIFVPIQNVTDTIIQVYEGWQNVTDESTRNLEENRLCLRLERLANAARSGGRTRCMG
ncbi:hypothetical protein FBUS_11576 [Fasciolopsis buskii]|uniref:Uncharacterized protein n=1 Tax=Fasciolopsis buskii TaxID=27845 RepID=A0A8E0RYW1_9TREM|nr:hypothetical protein FBUS_11576 [Fasciolopsis buski]